TVTGSLECHMTRGGSGGDRACDGANPGGRVGLSRRLGEAVELRANVGQYVRAPTLGELYGVSAVVRGNPTLAAESGETVDAGIHVQGRVPRIAASADGF